MIQQEILPGGTQVCHYSDEGMMMRQQETGFLYDEAIDVIPCVYTYTETDIPIYDKNESENLTIF